MSKTSSPFSFCLTIEKHNGGLASGLAVLLMVFEPLHASARETALIGDESYLEPQRLVTVGQGKRLNLYCTGKASSTVVFDAGRGDGSMVWALVQSGVARNTRACSYVRCVKSPLPLFVEAPSALPRVTDRSVFFSTCNLS
jgi:hypothetical protein